MSLILLVLSKTLIRSHCNILFLHTFASFTLVLVRSHRSTSMATPIDSRPVIEGAANRATIVVDHRLIVGLTGRCEVLVVSAVAVIGLEDGLWLLSDRSHEVIILGHESSSILVALSTQLRLACVALVLLFHVLWYNLILRYLALLLLRNLLWVPIESAVVRADPHLHVIQAYLGLMEDLVLSGSWPREISRFLLLDLATRRLLI